MRFLICLSAVAFSAIGCQTEASRAPDLVAERLQSVVIDSSKATQVLQDIEAMGFAAVPELIVALDDMRILKDYRSWGRPQFSMLDHFGGLTTPPDYGELPVLDGWSTVAVSDVAAEALRRISGEDFGYWSRLPPEERRSSREMWEAWYLRQRNYRALRSPEPQPYVRTAEPQAPKLGARWHGLTKSGHDDASMVRCSCPCRSRVPPTNLFVGASPTAHTHKQTAACGWHPANHERWSARSLDLGPVG